MLSQASHTCRRFRFPSELSFASLECQSRNSHKKVHGSGWNPAEPPQTRCNLWFNEKHQRNKSKLSWKINSAVVSFTPHRPCAFKDTNSEQSKKRKLTCIPQIKPHKGEGFLRHSLSTFCLLLCAQKKVAAWCEHHQCRKYRGEIVINPRQNSNIEYFDNIESIILSSSAVLDSI